MLITTIECILFFLWFIAWTVAMYKIFYTKISGTVRNSKILLFNTLVVLYFQQYAASYCLNKSSFIILWNAVAWAFIITQNSIWSVVAHV